MASDSENCLEEASLENSLISIVIIKTSGAAWIPLEISMFLDNHFLMCYIFRSTWWNCCGFTSPLEVKYFSMALASALTAEKGGHI